MSSFTRYLHVTVLAQVHLLPKYSNNASTRQVMACSPEKDKWDIISTKWIKSPVCKYFGFQRKDGVLRDQEKHDKHGRESY